MPVLIVIGPALIRLKLAGDVKLAETVVAFKKNGPPEFAVTPPVVAVTEVPVTAAGAVPPKAGGLAK